MELNNIIDYDAYLFNCFKNLFVKKFPERFSNPKLYDTWGRKCQFLLNFLKKLSKKSSSIIVKRALEVLLDFIRCKNNKTELQYLASFESPLFEEHKKEILSFRNMIAGTLLNFIYKREYENAYPDLLVSIDKVILMILLEKYNFLKGIYELLKASFLEEKRLGILLISILNNENIIQKIIDHDKCTLNSKQKNYLINNQFTLNNYASYINEFKELKVTIDELCVEINSVSTNKINNKKNKKRQGEIDQISVKNPSNRIMNESKEETQNSNSDNINLDNIPQSSQNSISPTIRIELLSKENSELKGTIELLNQKNSELKNQIESLERQNKLLNKTMEETVVEYNKNINDLNNKISILETKISMICYRDLIKDIINYSFSYFKPNYALEIGLKKKVNIIKNYKSYNVPVLNVDEKKIFSEFIDTSFLTLVKINKNVHEGGYIDNYSISDFITKFHNYLENEEFEFLMSNERDVLFNDMMDIPDSKTILPIIQKIGFSYEEEFI